MGMSKDPRGHLTRLFPRTSTCSQPLHRSFQLNCTSATRNACVQEVRCSHVAGVRISIFDRILQVSRGQSWMAGGACGWEHSGLWPVEFGSDLLVALLLGTSQMDRETAMPLNCLFLLWHCRRISLLLPLPLPLSLSPFFSLLFSSLLFFFNKHKGITFNSCDSPASFLSVPIQVLENHQRSTTRPQGLTCNYLPEIQVRILQNAPLRR
jgi:hypothetical protein